MEIGFLYSLVIFMSILSSTFQLDLLTRHHKRFKELFDNFGFFFNRNHLESVLLSANTQISLQCETNIIELFDFRNKNKSVQFFDAWSTLPVGLLYDQESSFGNFDECEAASIKSRKLDGYTIKGKYTLIKAYLNFNSNVIDESLPLFDFAICLPQGCNNEDIYDIFTRNFNTIKQFLELFDKSISYDETENYEVVFRLHYHSGDISESDRTAANIGTVVFSFILILVILSSFYELITSKMNGKPNLLLKSFSIFSNCKQLFHIQPKNSTFSQIIECLNGIRALSLIWNIYGHTYMWSLSRPETSGPVRIATVNSLYGRLLTSAHVSVDSFFLLSGLLIAWTGLHRMSKENGRIKIKLMYLHRYLRLTPAYAATILFASGLFIFVGNGPVWYNQTLPLAKTCQNYWWRDLLYISNLYPFEDMCIGHSWFLAVEMQLYIFAPFILIGLWKRPKEMCWLLVVMLYISLFSYYNARIIIKQDGFVFEELMMGDSIYFKPHYNTLMRSTPWINGILLGYILFRQRQRPLRLSQLKIAFGWIVALFGILLTVFGPEYYYANQIEPSPFVSALYESLGRFIWTLSVSWIIFSCYMGYSELVNSFLSHAVWQIIARLNYTIYIIKTLINISNLAVQKTDLGFSNFQMVAEFWSDIGISASFAVLLSLMVEIPFMTIEKYFMKNSYSRL